jgi:Type III restriction enzyme, res subunit
LVRGGEADDLVANYGHLVVDECHHLSASSFELAAKRSKAKYILGLSATIARKDDHHPIIFMQCGPARFRVNAKTLAAAVDLKTPCQASRHAIPTVPTLGRPGRPAYCRHIRRPSADEWRNDLIFDDVLKALAGNEPPQTAPVEGKHQLFGRLTMEANATARRFTEGDGDHITTTDEFNQWLQEDAPPI